MMRLFTLTIILFACGCFTPTLKSRGNVTASGSGSSSVSPFTFSPMSGSVGTTVTVTGMDFSTVSSVSLGGVPAVITNQTNSSLQFIVMPGSTYSRLTITTPSALYSSSDYFTVTAPALPLNQQGAKLIGSGYISTPYESTVALSADGNTLAIGGSGDNASQGAFWVFTKSGGVWTQQGGKMISTGNTGAAWQGDGLSLSADGNTLLVSGDGDNGGVGAVWVWTRSNGVWTQQAGPLVGTGMIGAANLGSEVALSYDGNTAVAGGGGDNGNAGAIWVWTRSGTTWSQQGGKLTVTGNTGSALVRRVSLSGDGNTLLVGGQMNNASQGAVWVFTRSAGVWTQQAGPLVGTGNTGAAMQGYKVALNADGNTALWGGWQNNGANGAMWVFTRSAGVWTQQAGPLVGTGNIGAAGQGVSASLSADGNTAIWGGYQDNGGIGAGWVWTRSGTVWSQYTKLVPVGNIGAAQFGSSYARISADGSTAVFGAFSDNTNIGAAFVFAP